MTFSNYFPQSSLQDTWGIKNKWHVCLISALNKGKRQELLSRPVHNMVGDLGASCGSLSSICVKTRVLVQTRVSIPRFTFKEFLIRFCNFGYGIKYWIARVKRQPNTLHYNFMNKIKQIEMGKNTNWTLLTDFSRSQAIYDHLCLLFLFSHAR